MAVYNYDFFPFEDFTIDEIARLFMDAVDIGDKEFAAACREQLKHCRVEKNDRKAEGEPDGKK